MRIDLKVIGLGFITYYGILFLGYVISLVLSSSVNFVMPHWLVYIPPLVTGLIVGFKSRHDEILNSAVVGLIIAIVSGILLFCIPDTILVCLEIP